MTSRLMGAIALACLLAMPAVAEDALEPIHGHVGQLDPALDGIGSEFCRYDVINYWGKYATSETLPCGSYAKVLNTANDLSVIVKIIDTNPKDDGLTMELTPGAADAIGAHERTKVTIVPLKNRTN